MNRNLYWRVFVGSVLVGCWWRYFWVQSRSADQFPPPVPGGVWERIEQVPFGTEGYRLTDDNGLIYQLRFPESLKSQR